MSDKPWKAFERKVAELVYGRRFWSNSGEQVDVRSEFFEVQCKNVKTISLNAIEKILDEMAAYRKLPCEVDVTKEMFGDWDAVAVKGRKGKGKRTRILFIMDGVAVMGLIDLIRHYRNEFRNEFGEAGRKP